MMSNLIETAHHTKIETTYQRDLLVQTNDALLTLHDFIPEETKVLKLFEKQYTKEVILT